MKTKTTRVTSTTEVRMRTMIDLAFLAGDFLHGDLPVGKEYLSHYFNGEAERAFLSYVTVFPHTYTEDSFKSFYLRFTDHTGINCSTRWVRKLCRRLIDIERALVEASKNFDLERVGAIKSGKVSF